MICLLVSYVCSILGLPTKPITNDDADRLFLCLHVLSDRSPEIITIFSQQCRNALSIMLSAKAEEEASIIKVNETMMLPNISSQCLCTIEK